MKWLEYLVLFVVLPVLFFWLHMPLKYVIPLLWITAFFGLRWSRRALNQGLRASWVASAVTWRNLRPILLRFLLSAIPISVCVALFAPEMLFSFVREKPLFWAVVMVLYPVISVVVQEVVYRSFFFARYAEIFGTKWGMLLASGLTFGFAHLVFQNWLAPLLCMVGGVMFAYTYARHRSLALVSFEHALYGNFLFTIGLGKFFYHGSVAVG